MLESTYNSIMLPVTIIAFILFCGIQILIIKYFAKQKETAEVKK